jgi:hypothetical protein
MNVFFKAWVHGTLISVFVLLGTSRVNAAAKASGLTVLQSKTYRHYIEQFNRRDGDKNPEHAAFPNSEAWNFLSENCPFFDSPDKEVEKTYYYRWWLYRKHIKKESGQFVISEFIKREPICCPAGHQLNEGRWLRNRRVLDDYVAHWFSKSKKGGDPRRYSFWAADACYGRFLATGDKNWVIGVLPHLVENYKKWEENNHVGGNLFYQNDDRDGMEKSAGGPGLRPTINSYMYADAMAISKIAGLAGKKRLSGEFRARAGRIKAAVQKNLWDKKDEFFKTVHRKRGHLVAVKTREAIGFIPWYFNLPDGGYEIAWKHLMDPKGFFAPFGPTTAERRDPTFMTRKDNTPWDGQSWPYATTQTLVAMANLLNNYTQEIVSKKDYFKLLKIYTSCHYSHYKDGTPMLGEWCHPITGKWYIRPWSSKSCSAHYNHSGFCDLIITGLVGIRPQAGADELVVHPLLPENTWDYFCLEGVPYHGRVLTVIWDKTGKRYKRGNGLQVLCDGRKIGQRQELGPIRLKLSASMEPSEKQRG